MKANWLAVATVFILWVALVLSALHTDRLREDNRKLREVISVYEQAIDNAVKRLDHMNTLLEKRKGQ